MLVERDGLAYSGSESRPFTGRAYERHANGAPAQEIPYRDGRRHDAVRRWYDDGALAFSGEYDDGARTGRAQWFYPHGALAQESSFRADLLHGPHREWFANGKLELDCVYREGELDGLCREWYADGTAKRAATYVAGKLAGPLRAWHADGSPRFACTYREGIADGPCQEWFGANRPAWRATFAGGTLAGELVTWHPTGKRRFSASAHQGTPDGEWRKWHADGTLRQRGTWRDGKLDGVWEEWNERGRLLERAEYRGGERLALRQWYANGQPRLAAHQQSETRVWQYQAWRPDGGEQGETPLLHGLYPFLFAPPKTARHAPPGDSPSRLTDTQRSTLASLRPVPDQPLAELRFVGDYDFTSYLVRGMPGRWYGLPPLSATPPSSGEDCSTVVTTNRRGETLFAYNHDHKQEPVLVVFTAAPGAYASVSVVSVPSMLDPAGAVDLLAWDGERVYLRAPYYPMVGMNERGVAVAGMSSDGQEPRIDPRRATLSYSQLIRLILDFAGDVDEAVDLIGAYNWQHDEDHLLVADRSGRSVVVEFVDDQLVTVPAAGRWQVATNFRLSGRPTAEWRGRCWRFDRATATLIERAGDLDPVAALGLLSSISMRTPLQTASSTVFDLTTGDVLLAVHRDYGRPSRFHLQIR